MLMEVRTEELMAGKEDRESSRAPDMFSIFMSEVGTSVYTNVKIK